MMTFREAVAQVPVYSGEVEIAHLANEASFFLKHLGLLLGGGFAISLFVPVQYREDPSFRECRFIQYVLCAVCIGLYTDKAEKFPSFIATP